MCKKTCSKVLATIFILIALALATAVTIRHQESFAYIVYISRFFDVMIPILAVGALIKYLVCAGHHCGCCHKHDETCTCQHHEEEK
jgi:hypothetical protein